MNLYRRATKHFDMKRIKELNEKKDKINLQVKVPTPDPSDWRAEIDTK